MSYNTELISTLNVPEVYKKYVNIHLSAALESPLGKDIVRVYLFGSCARGEIRSGSDIDLAFVIDNGLNYFEFRKELTRYKPGGWSDPEPRSDDYISSDWFVCTEDEYEVGKKEVFYTQFYIDEEGLILYERT